MSAGAPAPVSPQMPLPESYRRHAISAAYISLQPMVLSAIALPATAFIIRRLGPEQYGEWVTATTISLTVNFITNLGLRGTFVRAIAREPHLAAERLANQLGLRCVLAVLAAVVGFAACLVMHFIPSTHYSWTTVECMAVTCVGLIIAAIFTTGSDLLQGLQRFPTVAAINMAAGLLLTAASVVAVLMNGGAVAVAASYLTGPILSVLIVYWVVEKQHFPIRMKWNVKHNWQLLVEARFIALQQFLTSSNSNIESLIIPGLMGAMPFGFFAAGTLLATRLSTIPDGVGTVAYPAIAQKYVQSGRAALRTAGYFLVLVMLACVGAALGVSVLAGPIANLLFPGKAAICEHVMRVSIWLLPLMGTNCVLGYALNAVHADKAQAKASGIGAVLSIVVAIFMVWKWGITGAAWSMVVRYAVQVIVLAPTVIRTAQRLWRENSDEPPASFPPNVVVQAA